MEILRSKGQELEPVDILGYGELAFPDPPLFVLEEVTNGDGWYLEVPVCILCDEYIEDCRCC